MDLIGQIVIPFATAFLGAFAGWFFKRHRLQKENVQLDKVNEAQDITNFGAAVDTWKKLVAALDEQIVKLLAQSKEDSTRIAELTQEVYNLRRQVDQLQKQLARYQGEEAERKNARRPSGLLFLLALLLPFLLPSCKPVQMIGGSEQHTVERETTSRQSDSVFVYIGDSVIVREKGDTVWVTHCRTRYIDRWRDRHDTIVCRDSVMAEIPIPVEKPISGWMHFQIWAGRLLLILIAIRLLVHVAKRYLRPVNLIY